MSAITPPAAPAHLRGMAYLRAVWERRDFAWYLALSNLKARHASTALGVAWWLIGPTFLGLVYLLVFGVMLDVSRGLDNYIGFLLSGLFPYYFTRDAVMGGTQSLIANARLVTTQRFPRLLLPLSAEVQGAIGFSASLIPFFAINTIASGSFPGPEAVFIIPVFAVHTMFNLGISLVIAQLAVPFRDIGTFMPYMLRLWLYLSPVIYPLDQRIRDVSETLYTLLSFNPMTSILGLYRVPMLGNELEIAHLVGAIAWSVGLLAVGTFTFMRNEDKIVRHL